MNRKILFKAKRIDWKSLPKKEWWVEGDVQHTISKNIVLIVEAHCDKVYLCDSSTLCQYTGLTDKTQWEKLSKSEQEKFLSSWNYTEDRQNKIKDWKGKKIWEGDIVKCNKRTEEFDLYKVVWRKYFADFGVEPINPKYEAQYPIGLSDGVTLHGCDYKVIGNIFDNAELLEVE